MESVREWGGSMMAELSDEQIEAIRFGFDAVVMRTDRFAVESFEDLINVMKVSDDLEVMVKRLSFGGVVALTDLLLLLQTADAVITSMACDIYRYQLRDQLADDARGGSGGVGEGGT